MSWHPRVYYPPEQLAQRQWHDNRSRALASDMVVSLAFAAESVAAGYAGEYPLMAALGVLSVCMQVRAYYLAGTVRMPDYSQAQTVEQQQ